MFTGTTLNAAGIVIGGVAGLAMGRQIAAPTQVALRGFMGVFTVFIGLRLAWQSFNGSLFQIFKQLVIVLLAMTLGKLLGRLLGIQRTMNRLGHRAGERFALARPDDPHRFNEGFVICSVLFCAAPLAPLGAVADGLSGCWEPLAIKTVMDGLAAMGFVCVFGWGTILSVIPMVAYQASLTMIAARLQPFLHAHDLLDPVNATVGLLVFCVSLVILELKKVEIGDYLPSIFLAPLISWLWR